MKVYYFGIVSLLLLTIACSKEEDFISEEFSIANGLDNQGSTPLSRDDDRRNRGGDHELDVIDDWLQLFLRLDRYATGMRPNATARAIAYINLAAYETVVPFSNRLTSSRSILPAFQLGNEPEERIDRARALNACYADVLNHFLINLPSELRSEIGDLEETWAQQLEAQNDAAVSSAVAWGSTIAGAVIAYSQTDAAAEAQVIDPQPLNYVPPIGEGYWTFSAEPERALFPYWSSVRTFAISPDQTSSIPPLVYSEETSSEYYEQMYEVYESNNLARESQDENLWIAEFWSDDVENLMMSPPARQISIAHQLISEDDMRYEEALYLLLKVGFALNDAAVSTWDDKYTYMVMRPSVFIQEYIDPNYQTNLFRLIPWPNPTFPAYPSGHSAFASAAAGVFIDFFGNNYNFTDRTHEGRTEFRGNARTFSTFEQMARENAFSRIPLGVHMKMDCTEGLRLGYEISEAVNTIDLLSDRRPNT